jgi:hypothetical protein
MHRWAEILVAGAVSGLVHLAAQGCDIRLAKNRLDDRVLAGRLLPVAPQRAVAVGTVLHLAIAVISSAVFRLAMRDRLRGPMWWRGGVAGLVQTFTVYPLALLEDFHPAARDGQLDSYQSLSAFCQQLWRRVISGAVLGMFTPPDD